MANFTRSLQLIRNQAIALNKAEAVTRVKELVGNLENQKFLTDGTPLIARYYSPDHTSENNKVVSMLALVDVHNSVYNVSFLDLEGLSEDNKSYVDQQITNVNNKITEIENILMGDDGQIIDVNVEITNIKNELTTITEEIAKLANVQYVGGNGIEVTKSETEVKVEAKISGQADNVLTIGADKGLYVGKQNIPEYQIVKDTNAGEYAAVYRLQKDGIQAGVEINIPKDQFLKSVAYDDATHELTFTFETTAGETSTTINIAELIDTYNAGDGLSINGNVFSVNVDTESEPFLTVSADGIKLSGIVEKINEIVSDKLVEAGQSSVEAGEGMNVSVDASGKVYTVGVKVNPNENALTMDENGLYVNPYWDCGTY